MSHFLCIFSRCPRQGPVSSGCLLNVPPPGTVAPLPLPLPRSLRGLHACVWDGRVVRGQLLLPSGNADPVLATVNHRMSTRPPSQRRGQGIKGGWGRGRETQKRRKRISKSFKSTLTLILRFYFSNLDLETTACVRQPPPSLSLRGPPLPLAPHPGRQLVLPDWQYVLIQRPSSSCRAEHWLLE